MEDKLASKQALKASGLVGGGQVINIIIGLVRTKIIAILLGPSGVGLVGILTTIIELIKSISSFGLPFSGVRDISIAESNQSQSSSIKIISVFLKWIVVSAVLGLLLTIIFAIPINNFVFGNEIENSTKIAFLSIAVFFGVLNAGFATVIQGKRAITLLVKTGIISNAVGSTLMIIIYYYLKEKGIVLAMIFGGAGNLICTYFFYRKLKIRKYEDVKLIESWNIAKSMIKIGFFTIIVSFFDHIMSLGLRAFINQEIGANGVGIFTATITIATTYLSVVLTAMASDYYPKLASIHNNNLQLNQVFNSQLKVVLLLSSPIIIGMISYSEFVINILFTHEFIEGKKILEWQVLGDFIKIISWALGYVILAKGIGKIYVFSNILYNIFYTALVIFCWPLFNLLGVGIAFFISNTLLLIFCIIYCYKKFHIVINKNNMQIILIYGILIFACFIIANNVNDLLKNIACGIILLFSISLSFFFLNKIVNFLGLIKKLSDKFN